MAVIINTALAGVPTRQGRPTSTVLASQLINILGDQAMVYERTTNNSAKGDASAVAVGNEAHNHDEAGNLLYWPIMNMVFGDQEFGQNLFSGSPASDSTSPIFISVAGSGSDTDNVVLLYFPIWIPAGWASKPHTAYLTTNGKNPRCKLTLETTINNTVAGQNLVPFYRHTNLWSQELAQLALSTVDNGEIFIATFTPAAAGLHVVKITTYVNALYDSNFSESDNRYIYELTILPDMPATAVPSTAGPVPAFSSADYVDVGNPDAANSWNPTGAALAVADAPLGPALKIAAENDAYLQELLFGFAASGISEATGLTITPHDHAVGGGRGLGVEYCLGAWCWGPFDDATAPYDAISGNGARPPMIDGLTYKTVRKFNIQTPINTENEGTGVGAADSKLKCAVLVYHDYGGGKTPDGYIKVTLTPSSSPAAVAVEYQAAAAGGYQLLTSASVFSFQSGGLTEVKFEMKDAFAATNQVALCGACLYFDQ